MPWVVTDFEERIRDVIENQHTLNARVLSNYLQNVHQITTSSLLDQDLHILETWDFFGAPAIDHFLMVLYNPDDHPRSFSVDLPYEGIISNLDGTALA